MTSRHRSRALVILLVIILATPLAFASPADEKQAKVDAVFAPFDKPNSPGCAVGVQNGDFVYKRGYGLGSIELQVPLTPSSVFYMGSVSKQFTAASVVLAQEQGLLSLDDDVRRWIPELPDYGHKITLRQMLHHTSGLRDVLALLALAGQHAEDVHPLPEFIDLVARQKQLNYTPGEEYLYSNSNFVLLAEIVHRASGKPFSQFADENIFRPLGMTHTRFYDDHTVVLPGRVAAYAPRNGGGFRVDWSTNFEKVGDGGLMSSVEDLLLWDRNFYNNKLGKGTLLKELQTKGVLNSGKPIDYALGLVISDYKGLPTVEHGGALFGYRTDILRFPEQNFSVITLCNLATATPGVYAQKVADVYLADKFKSDTPEKKREAASGFKADVQAFAGSYRFLDDHSPMTLEAKGEALSLRNIVLRATASNRFVDPNGGQFAFEPSAGGGIRLTVTSSAGTARIAERYETAKLTPAELAEYAGDYYSDELLVTYKLRVNEGKLTMAAGWNDPVPLDPTVRDDFRGRGGIVSFVRQNGKLAGFDLYAGRVRNIRFVKK